MTPSEKAKKKVVAIMAAISPKVGEAVWVEKPFSGYSLRVEILGGWLWGHVNYAGAWEIKAVATEPEDVYGCDIIIADSDSWRVKEESEEAA